MRFFGIECPQMNVNVLLVIKLTKMQYIISQRLKSKVREVEV